MPSTSFRCHTSIADDPSRGDEFARAANYAKFERLLEQFETLTAAVWSILLDGALSYLTVICERDHLPLGSEHVFVQELKTLHDAEKILGEGRYEKHLVSAAMEQRAKAEEILNMVIDRAPVMLNLD